MAQASNTFSIIAVILIGLSSFTSILSINPATLLLAITSQFQRVFALIGSINNTFV